MMMVKATRDAFGEALVKVGERHAEVVVVNMDLASATKTSEFGKRFPERFFEVGIAEQNGLSIAAGLAMEGFRPFVCSFGAFITGRYDQIRISCAYNRAPVVIVGTHSGLAIGKDGATQMGLEDVNLMSSVPGMEIFQPADVVETDQIVNYLARERNLAYLRISRNPQPPVYKDDYVFEFNKGKVLREGRDAGLLATGDLVYQALNAAQQLDAEGIEAGVVGFSTLKPIDADLILALAGKWKMLFTLEDHSIIGGLGSRVCEVIAEAGLPVRVRRGGVKDCFGESGPPDELYRKHGLDVESIVQTVKNSLK